MDKQNIELPPPFRVQSLSPTILAKVIEEILTIFAPP